MNMAALFRFQIREQAKGTRHGQNRHFHRAAYLQFMLRDDFGSARIDFQKLVERMAGDREILRSYYYDCEPYQSDPPTDQEKERFSRAQRFHYALDRIPRFQVRLGKLARRGRDDTGRQIFVQKRVDILMGVDLVLAAAKKSITDAAILAGDSDFLPAIEAAKPEGVVIHLFHGEHPHVDLVAKCDERTQFDQTFVDSILK